MSRLARLSTYVRQLNPVAIGLELVIVFVGVYLAFVLAEYREERRLDDRRDRVIALLQDGASQFEGLFTGFAQFHEGHNAEVRAVLERGEVPDFGDQLYVAPQYPIDVIAYVLTNESFDVFDLDLYLPLTQYANGIKRLMSIEAELTDLADRYIPLGPDDDAALRREQRQLALRYYRYLEARRRTAADLADRSRTLAVQLAPDG